MLKPKLKTPKKPLRPIPKKRFTDYDNLPIMLNVKDIALIMRISRAGAYNLVNSEDFPKTTIGKRLLVQKTDLINWLRQGKQ